MPEPINPIKITENAIKQIKNIRREKKISDEYGLRVGMQGGGCGGMSFVLGFDTARESDGIFMLEELKIFIEKKDTMYLLGMVIDFIENEEEKGFTFVKEGELNQSKN